DKFMEEVYPVVAQRNLAKLAIKRSIKKGTQEEVELARVQAEFERAGTYVFGFDSGTTPAVKQMRHMLLMSGAGSINLEIDEIGSNLLGNVEVLTTFLELFDVGKIKQKLTKNTNENQRGEEIDGRTPTNLLLFGTPAKIFDGGKVESEFISFQETGYARRCIFGYSKIPPKRKDVSARDILNNIIAGGTDQYLTTLASQIELLADEDHFEIELDVSEDVTLLLLEYKLKCEMLAADMPEHDEIKKAELSHRYFKALKLAGAYAFIEDYPEITEDHLYSAIKLVEDSGKAFNEMLSRDKNYAKLAQYIASCGTEVTHVDLVEALPCYRGSVSQKQELMTLAIAWGYKNNIIIKKSFTDGIEFLHGETLKTTDLNSLILSYSDDIATGYESTRVPFDKLNKLTQEDGFHWCNHGFLDQHRKEENAIPGFNLLVLDIDDGTSIETAKMLLAEYTYHMYTTKRHTDAENRFRIVIPLSHELKMDAHEYKEFMKNVFEWLPFKPDTQTNQRARKWLSCDGQYWNNEGELLDALQFIPKTSKNEERQAKMLDMQSLDNIERWFLQNTGTGNRSNQLIKYALLLVDSGLDISLVSNKVLALNNKLADKLDETEILTTIMQSATRAFIDKQKGA
ncbi:MAG: primase C-terminal domain-containing protein, partial [Acinetobacter junii]